MTTVVRSRTMNEQTFVTRQRSMLTSSLQANLLNLIGSLDSTLDEGLAVASQKKLDSLKRDDFHKLWKTN